MIRLSIGDTIGVKSGEARLQVSIDSIKVRKRIRTHVDDVDELAESMRRHGQLHPVTITPNNVLVSGRRRLEAARLLGWRTIDAIVIRTNDRADRLELELDENIQRAPLSTEEVERALAKIEKLRNPGFFGRIWRAIVQFFRRLFRRDD